MRILRRSVAANGIRLWFMEAGRGASILCLHGRWGRGETWGELIERYCGRYRVIAPDQRGHGLSDKPPAGYRAEDLAADADGLLQALGASPAIVVGHSMGARVAAYLTALHPGSVRALAFLDETLAGAKSRIGGPREDPLDDGLTTSWPVPYATRRDAVRDLEGRFPRATNVDYFLHSLHETEGGYGFLFDRAGIAAIGREYRDWRHLLPRIQCPTLLVRAADSWCMPGPDALEMQAALRDSTLVEIPGSDHMVYGDNPIAFYEALDRFLGRMQTD